MGSKPEWAYLWILFWGTLGLYTFNTVPFPYLKGNRIVPLFALLIIAGFWYWQITPLKLMIMVVAGLIGVFYVVPLTAQQKTLRNFGRAKAIWIGLSWTLATTEMAIIASNLTDWNLVASRFCWVFGLSLLFDYRDREIDARHGIMTWGTQMKLEQLKKIVAGLYILAIILELFRTSQANMTSLPFILGLILAQGLIWLKLRPNSSLYFYTVVLDSTLIWPAIISILWSLKC